MNYKIKLYGNMDMILLEATELRKGKITKRIELDNENEIRTYLHEFIPQIKKIKKEGRKAKIPLPEKGVLEITNYREIKNHEACRELRKKVKEVSIYGRKIKKLKKMALTGGLILGIPLVALMNIKAKTRKSEQGENQQNIKQENEYENEIINIDEKIEIRIKKNDNLNTVVATPHVNVASIEIEEETEKSNDWIEQSDILLEQEIEIPLAEREEIPIDLSRIFENIGSKIDNPKKINVEENYGDLTEKYAEIIGIDVEILNCILAQERGYHATEIDAGGAIGVAQIQYSTYVENQTRPLYLRNELTGEVEEIKVTKELLQDLEGNIKVGATILQNNLDRYNGNILLAIQAYNYGVGAMKKVLTDTSEATGISIEDIINDPSNLSWVFYVEQYANLHREGRSYGDCNYLSHVLQFYKEEEITLKYGDEIDTNYYTVTNIEKEKSQTY